MKLREWQSANSLSLSQRLEAQIPAFSTLSNLLSKEHVNKVERIIYEFLLPDCLLIDETSRHLISRHRDILSNWLGDLGDVERDRIRAKAIDIVLPLLESSAPQAACWIISSIGYRDSRIVKSLWQIVQNNDDEVGDIALSVLTWLGVLASEKKGLLKELHLRAVKRFNTRLCWGIAQLGDPSSAPIILDNWLSPHKRSEFNVDTSLAFTALREIANADENNEKLQNFIWTKCRKLVEQEPKALYRNFDIGHVIVECNCTEVIPDLFGWLGQHPEWFDKPDWALYLAQDRLEKCVRPNQLEGWSKIGDQIIFRLLLQSACENIKDDGLFTTHEWLIKETAWKTLLRAGKEDALLLFDQAVANEDGRFIRQKIMDYLSCFRIDPLPERVFEWITESYDDPGNGDSREISYRMAAVRMARSTATEPALEALLNFGFRYKGEVITESTDAVVEVAVALMRQGNTSLLARLVELFVNSSDYGQRLACVNALEVLTSFPENHLWLSPHIEKLIPLVYDEDRDQIERGLLLNTLGHLNGWVIPNRLLQDLVLWAKQPDRWIGGGSLQILASHRELDKYPELLQDVLGLEPVGEHWRLASNKVRFDWAPYIIGELYHINPDAYWPTIVSLLAQDWRSVVQVIRWLQATHGKAGQPEISQQVVEALIRRVKEIYSSNYGETEVFDVLARLSATTLIKYSWDEIVNKWMPDIRVELANTLGKVITSEDNKQLCLSTLEMLAEDSLYPVRRAAYRGLSRQSGDYLFRLCKSWLDSPLLNLNIRAAEACGWVVNIMTDDGQDGYEVLNQQCTSHVESKVRESARRSWEERRQRLWAKEYLNKVMDVRGKDNSEILRTWCYGDALAQIGDDECIDVLREYTLNSSLLPNVRYWIKQIMKELEANWKKTTQKWPDPWTDVRGAIERGDGKLIVGQDKGIDIRYSTWQLPASIPGEKHTWGGVIIASFEHFINLDEAVLEIEGHRRGKIISTGFSGDTATFLGTGPYPSLESAQ